MQHNRYAVCEGQVIQVIVLSYTYRSMTFTFDCTLTSTESNRQILTVNPEVIKVSVNLINITTLISNCKHSKNAKNRKHTLLVINIEHLPMGKEHYDP